ncbi:MAG: hypothetical protein CMI96_00465 [Pelagibacteraceae bacterium]|nr:hypothetical protein [Pelagibacteraceae bacterium]|tara:strand:- start:3906 stop:4520 length:615 start_codon:yes stop_codon:yes gene_type:complete
MNDASLNLFFSTPVWVSTIDNYQKINNELYDYINNMRINDPDGVKISNVNGWHSKNFNANEGAPKEFIQQIKNSLSVAMESMRWDLNRQTVKISNMWAIINNKNAHNARHHHGNSSLSAAYYVKAPENCGNIVFYDPRPAPVYSHPIATEPNRLNSTVHSIKPKDGSLILFPSYLDHSVDPNTSSEERVVISFNVILLNKNHFN